MRKVIAATLALTPILLHAQANPPAQTQASSNVPVLQSKLVQPKELGVANADRGATHIESPLRVSTGVVAPKLVHTVEILSDSEFPWRLTPVDRKVVVDMIVDQNGKPSDLKIVQSAGLEMDKNVLLAVSQYRFKPGTLDHAPAAVPLQLEIIMRNPLR